MAGPPTVDPPVRKRRSRIAATVRALLRTRITTGLIVVLPIWVTFLLVKFFFELMRDASRWVVVWFLHSDDVAAALQQMHVKWRVIGPDESLTRAQEWGINIFSVLFTLFLLYTIGVFAANIVGRRFIELMERIVDRVPLVKTIYRSTKQIVATFSGEQSQSFQRVALIPFPQERMRSVGFITSIFKDSVTGEELASVFIPTTPNPTTGYLQILKRKELVELKWSVEDAVRVIMSGGILKPEFLTIVPTKDIEDWQKRQFTEHMVVPTLESPPKPDAQRT